MEPKEPMISYKYFQGHQCHLSSDKLSCYSSKHGRFRKFLLDAITVNPDDVRAQLIFRSYAAFNAEKHRQYTCNPASIHPYSKLRIWLETGFVLSMLASNTLVAVHYSKFDPDEKDYQHYMLYSLDFLYFLNIFANFFTGYIEGHTQKYVVLDLKMIAFKYARSWMCIDLFSSSYFFPGLVERDHKIHDVIMESLKILRLPVLLVYTNNVMTVLRAGIFKKTIVEILILMWSFLTWNIYFQFANEYLIEGTFGPTNPRNCSWMTVGNLWNATSEIRFTFALNRAVGMLRTNSNLHIIEQIDLCSQSFYIVSWLIAKLLIYHSCLKYIVSLFGSESASARYYIMTKQVVNYMNQRKFPPRIKKKIIKFYNIRFQSNFLMESRMIDCVSGQLREDIIMHTGRQLVREVEFLKQLPRPLLVQIGFKLHVVIFIAGDIIFKINSVGDCVYFIDKGTVAIYSESGKEVCHLEDGDFFGAISLILRRFRLTTAVAVTNCELFRLSKEDFYSTMACYPTVYESIKKRAINRYEETCVLDEHHKSEMRMNEN
ncbi:uncharacterized protein LOC101738521 [Bombyx mori]|uniref:Cyclic nucleotide-binding domain-containing protein n=1 Tax=Bombyx mori TaxID=7091 RepID=A0A8R2G9E6_BOMMO|nr:uncharacterized protein LOC101738521 [Bombyx mori]